MPRLKMYDKSSTEAWECSRTAIDEFLNDPHTFVMRRKLGLMSVPSFPLNLNTATDEILKEDFDALRDVQESDYWLFAKYNLNVVPFQHADFTKWRDGFEVSTKFILLYVDGDRGAKSFFPEPSTELGRLDFRTSLMIIDGDDSRI